MKIKQGVELGLVQPQAVIALIIANQIWQQLGQDLVWTSGNEQTDTRVPGSLHNAGQAIDLRTRYFSASDKIQASTQLKNSLGNSFDVVVYDTHIHIEYDPK